MSDNTSAYQVGQRATFKGYDEAPADGEAILAEGALVEITQINDQGDLVVQAVLEDGSLNTEIAETVFGSEIELLQEEAPAEEKAPAKKTAAKKKTTKKKAPAKKATKAKAETEDTEEAPADVEDVSSEVEEVEGEPAPFSAESVLAVIDSNASGKGRDNGALAAAKRLIADIDESYFKLGGVLSYIKEQSTFKAIGYGGKRGFADYVSAELGVDYRKAQYLIDIYNVVSKADVDRERLREIGWSKALQIARVGRDVSIEQFEEDFDQLIDLAKERTRDDLISEIKTRYTEITSRTDKVRMSKYNFALQAETAETVDKAFDSAKNLAGSDDPADIFAYIVQDWMMMTEGTDLSVEDAVSHLEERFNVKLSIAQSAEEEAPAEDAEPETVSEAVAS